MPIRINLLAEQQAAEEARRRDPVKRSIWAGSAVMALMLIWIANLQFKISGAKSDLAGQEARWTPAEKTFLQVSNSYREFGLIGRKLESLERHVTNRFLWGHPLNALQYAADEQVRVVSITGTSVSSEQKQIIVPTNMFFNLPPKPWWKWKADLWKTNVNEVARMVLGSITNQTNLARFQSQLIVNPPHISTTRIQISVQMEVVKPETVTEKITLTIRARDYGKPPGGRVDLFYSNIIHAPFLGRFLGKTNCNVQPDSIKPRDDQTDIINPTDLYIPFTVHGNFPERIRSNE